MTTAAPIRSGQYDRYNYPPFQTRSVSIKELLRPICQIYHENQMLKPHSKSPSQSMAQSPVISSAAHETPRWLRGPGWNPKVPPAQETGRIYPHVTLRPPDRLPVSVDYSPVQFSRLLHFWRRSEKHILTTEKTRERARIAWEIKIIRLEIILIV